MIGVLGMASSVVTGMIGSATAKKAQRRAAKQAKMFQAKLDNLEANRQAIIDPWAGITDLSGIAIDRSGMMTNTYSNLSVATQAAEMQIEEADIALANTLDTLMATGSGAGGATALAQAAKRSKKEVSAGIEQQEAANEKLRAQGEESLEQRRVAEKQRLEGIQISQADKVQQARAQGQQFMFGQREQREQVQLDRVSNQLENANMAMAQAQADGTAALPGMIGGVMSSLTPALAPKTKT